jgi:hypothetical protein
MDDMDIVSELAAEEAVMRRVWMVRLPAWVDGRADHSSSSSKERLRLLEERVPIEIEAAVMTGDSRRPPIGPPPAMRCGLKEYVGFSRACFSLSCRARVFQGAFCTSSMSCHMSEASLVRSV